MAPFRLNGPSIGFSLALFCHSGDSEMNRRQADMYCNLEIPLRVENSNYYVLPLWLGPSGPASVVCFGTTLDDQTHTLVVGAHIEWENRSHLTFRLPKGTEENSVEFTGFRWNAPPGIFCHQCTSSFCDDSIENRSSLSKWYFHRLESCTPNSSCLLVFRRETFRVFCLLWLAPSIDCGNCRKGLSAPNVPCVFVCVSVCLGKVWSAAQQHHSSLATWIALKKPASQSTTLPLDSEGDAERLIHYLAMATFLLFS